jgi:hypothetical protein
MLRRRSVLATICYSQVQAHTQCHERPVAVEISVVTDHWTPLEVHLRLIVRWEPEAAIKNVRVPSDVQRKTIRRCWRIELDVTFLMLTSFDWRRPTVMYLELVPVEYAETALLKILVAPLSVFVRRATG